MPPGTAGAVLGIDDQKRAFTGCGARDGHESAACEVVSRRESGLARTDHQHIDFTHSLMLFGDAAAVRNGVAGLAADRQCGGMTAHENRIVVTRTIDAPTDVIFGILTLPERHREFDGSGMVRADEKSQRIQAVGDVFKMNMHNERMGDYRMHNHVTAFAANKLVGWQPASDQRPDEPFGWEWVYELEAEDAGTTNVTLTYDWSRVENEKLRAGLPAVSEEQLEESLNLLAAAVADA